MFDFRKEVIINTDTLPVEDGGAKRVTVDSTYLKVLRCADYKLEYIKHMKKVTPEKGTCASVKLRSQSSASNASTVVITLGLDGTRAYGDFATNWAKTEKTLIADKVDGSFSQSLKTVLESNPIATIEDNEFTCKDPHMIIKSVEYLDNNGEVADFTNSSEGLDGEFDIKEGTRPKNTGEMLIENLRFPSYPNLRYAAANEEERPIPGKLYNLYVFDYVAPRVGLHGQSAVGQQINSATTHAFYVLEGLSANTEFAKITGKDANVPVVGE